MELSSVAPFDGRLIFQNAHRIDNSLSNNQQASYTSRVTWNCMMPQNMSAFWQSRIMRREISSSMRHYLETSFKAISGFAYRRPPAYNSWRLSQTMLILRDAGNFHYFFATMIEYAHMVMPCSTFTINIREGLPMTIWKQNDNLRFRECDIVINITASFNIYEYRPRKRLKRKWMLQHWPV